MAAKPIKVFYSKLTGRFYATRSYREIEPGMVQITGQKWDVTNDIGAAVVEHGVTFEAEGAGDA